MALDARRGPGFSPQLYDEILRRAKTKSSTKQPGLFRKPQENACEICRLNPLEVNE